MESVLFQAIKLWPEADSNAYLSIDVSTSNFLAFSQTLVSNYIDLELLEYSLILIEGESEEVILAANFAAYGASSSPQHHTCDSTSSSSRSQRRP